LVTQPSCQTANRVAAFDEKYFLQWIEWKDFESALKKRRKTTPMLCQGWYSVSWGRQIGQARARFT
jgi:hypothetical protein